MGLLLDLKVYDLAFNNVDIGYILDAQNDALERNSQWLMLIDLRLRLDKIKSEGLRENLPGSLVKYSPSHEYLKSDGILSFKSGYADLIKNWYEQCIEISMSIHCISEGHEIKWKYGTPTLRLKSNIINKFVNMP